MISRPGRALILGSSGGLGGALVQVLQQRGWDVQGLGRMSSPSIDYRDANSIQTASKQLAQQLPFQLIINTIGILHSDKWMPEKKLDDLNSEQLSELLLINTIGPALTIKDFSKLLDNKGSVMATLSAKVGSITDNKLGGWYSYRASKAALNMIIKTSSIELQRTKKNAILVAIHPGTVNTRLSKPFRGEQIGRNPLEAATDILNVIQKLGTDDTGTFVSYTGEKLPW